MRRCDASAFMAVSMEPPATSVSTSTTAKAHFSCISASTHSSTDQAKSAIHSSRRAPTRSQQVRHHRARPAGHRDGHRQQQAQLRVVEPEGVLDVEEHHRPAAPEQRRR